MKITKIILFVLVSNLIYSQTTTHPNQVEGFNVLKLGSTFNELEHLLVKKDKGSGDHSFFFVKYSDDIFNLNGYKIKEIMVEFYTDTLFNIVVSYPDIYNVEFTEFLIDKYGKYDDKIEMSNLTHYVWIRNDVKISLFPNSKYNSSCYFTLTPLEEKLENSYKK